MHTVILRILAVFALVIGFCAAKLTDMELTPILETYVQKLFVEQKMDPTKPEVLSAITATMKLTAVTGAMANIIALGAAEGDIKGILKKGEALGAQLAEISAVSDVQSKLSPIDGDNEVKTELRKTNMLAITREFLEQKITDKKPELTAAMNEIMENLDVIRAIEAIRNDATDKNTINGILDDKNEIATELDSVLRIDDVQPKFENILIITEVAQKLKPFLSKPLTENELKPILKAHVEKLFLEQKMDPTKPEVIGAITETMKLPAVTGAITAIIALTDAEAPIRVILENGEAPDAQLTNIAAVTEVESKLSPIDEDDQVKAELRKTNMLAITREYLQQKTTGDALSLATAIDETINTPEVIGAIEAIRTDVTNKDEIKGILDNKNEIATELTAILAITGVTPKFENILTLGEVAKQLKPFLPKPVEPILPLAEEPKAEEPKVPLAEEPKAEEPKAEEPKTEEPKMNEEKMNKGSSDITRFSAGYILVLGSICVVFWQ